jgi:hypothetical protein
MSINEGAKTFHWGRKPQEATPRAVTATAEQVKARREAKAAERGNTTNYTVKQELVIPGKLHTGEDLLAQIFVQVKDIGTYWEIRALKGPMTQSGDDADSTPPQTLGKIIIGNVPKISTAQALEVANGWVTDSCTFIADRKNTPVA